MNIPNPIKFMGTRGRTGVCSYLFPISIVRLSQVPFIFTFLIGLLLKASDKSICNERPTEGISLVKGYFFPPAFKFGNDVFT